MALILLLAACPLFLEYPGEADVEQRIFQLINDVRREAGLSELDNHEMISEVAREHSRNMAAGVVAFGHEGFTDRIEYISARIKVRAAGENVAFIQGSQYPAEDVVERWLEEPEHADNIFGVFDITGVGVASSADSNYYMTQIFVRQ